MKAISLKQPWPWAIFHAGKDIENRTWATEYRGSLLIHASKEVDLDGYLFLRTMGLYPPSPQRIDRGVVLGKVKLVDCVPGEGVDSRWGFGPWCWILEKPGAFIKPLRCRGKLGLFDVDLNTLVGGEK